MFRISCFADEISSDLHEQVAVLKQHQLHFVELRSMWNQNVLDLDDDQLREIKSVFDANGIGVSSIGSPIGKVDVHEDFATHMERFKRAVEAALRMETKYIRIFSFYMKPEELDAQEETVLNRLRQFGEIAKANGLVLLHENEAGIFGESSARCLALLENLDRTCFGAVLDPSNFVAAGEDVLKESYPRVKPYVKYLHIKDSKRATGEIVVAGLGDGAIREILGDLRDRENLFLSLEPHLSMAGQFKGFTGPELFGKACSALKKILDEQQIAYQ